MKNILILNQTENATLKIVLKQYLNSLQNVELCNKARRIEIIENILKSL